jgi:hypothetical protein
MTKRDELDQDKLRPKPSRSEEALRIIEEYANGLRYVANGLQEPSVVEPIDPFAE